MIALRYGLNQITPWERSGMVERNTELRLTTAQAARFQRLALPQLAVLLRTAGYLTHNGPQAEDLVQETMIKALRFMDRYTEGTDIKAWLLTILRRTHLDAIRANKHNAALLAVEQRDVPDRPMDEAGLFAPPWPHPQQLLERFGDQEIIAALQALPEEIRWTLLLVDVEQLDLATAAAILEVPEGTVKSRTHRGRGMLREALHPLAQQRGWIQAEESSHE
ncbi:MAG: sigma-70 family RNA polymerase sigma factor [Phycisphaerae bacterium]